MTRGSTATLRLRPLLVGISALGATLALGHGMAAHAGQVGSFTTASGNYDYTSGGGFPGFGKLEGMTEGTFTFDPFVSDLTSLAGTPIDAKLLISADATTAATSIPAGSNTILTQTFAGFITVSRVSDDAVLLQTTFVGAEIFEREGVHTIELSGSTNSGDIVIYGSDVLDASQLVIPRFFNFTLNLPGTGPGLQLNGNSFADFTATDQAGFNAELAVPEPGLITLGLSALPCLGILALRRRYRGQHSQV